jgi:hypothetical protein
MMMKENKMKFDSQEDILISNGFSCKSRIYGRMSMKDELDIWKEACVSYF